MVDKITLVCVTQDRIDNIKRVVSKVLPFVDKVVVVDGFSSDGTKEWLEQYSPKIFITQRRWDDNFSNQYNEYLKHIDEGWVLLCDDDELPSEKLLMSLRTLIEDSDDGNRYSCVEFKCHPIEIDNFGVIVRDTGPCDYYRQIFFLYQPDMKYRVDLHQALFGYKNGRIKRCQDTYYHIKSDRDEYRNACRNWWIAGVWLTGSTEGYKPKEWHEFRELVLSVYPEVKVFSDFNSILVKGNMDKRIKDYLWSVKDLQDEPPQRYMNELRAYWKYYFEKLHPSEAVPNV